MQWSRLHRRCTEQSAARGATPEENCCPIDGVYRWVVAWSPWPLAPHLRCAARAGARTVLSRTYRTGAELWRRLVRWRHAAGGDGDGPRGDVNCCPLMEHILTTRGVGTEPMDALGARARLWPQTRLRFRQQTRTCNNPPQRGGQPCDGPSETLVESSKHVCSIVVGTVWSDWAQTECLPGTNPLASGGRKHRTRHRNRERSCQPPVCGGEECAGNTTDIETIQRSALSMVHWTACGQLGK